MNLLKLSFFKKIKSALDDLQLTGPNSFMYCRNTTEGAEMHIPHKKTLQK